MPNPTPALPSIAELRDRRRALGITQGRLAEAAGVSQSLVAKVERGRVEPSYRNVRAMLGALDALEGQHRPEPTVGSLATRTMVQVRRSTLLTEAAHLLRRHAISQVPVMDGPLVVGSLTDRTVVACLTEPRRVARLPRLTVGEVMEEPFPQLDRATPRRVAAALLRHVNAILVTDSGRPSGIVTHSDLFKGL